MTLRIKSGRLLKLSLFDIANEIRLSEIEQTLKAKPEENLELYRRSTPEYIKYQAPPLFVRIGKKKILVQGREIEICLKARIYSIGVVTIISSVDFSGSMDELHKFSSLEEFNRALEKEISSCMAQLSKKIECSLSVPSSPANSSESYTIFHVYDFGKKIKTKELLSVENKRAIAKLLRFDSKELSLEEMESVFRNKTSYYDDDLVVLDVESCFIFDRVEPKDLIDAIEFAKLQLLELRYYDAGLDSKIKEAYAAVKAKPGFFVNYGKTLFELSEYKLSVTEIIDKADSTLKFLGDNYLARVYQLASEEFYLPDWKKSVSGKLEAMEDIYSKLNDRAEATRHRFNEILMLTFEFLIVLFFAFEIWKSYFA